MPKEVKIAKLIKLFGTDTKLRGGNFEIIFLVSGEADLVAVHVEDLIKSGVTPSDIAVIAPYNLQVNK